MANVSVYNMEGKEVGALELNDAVFGVEVNRGDRKEPVMQDRVQPGLLSGRAAAWYSLQHQEITPSD